MRSAYDVLGLEPSASTEAIRLAYRRLAKLHHPDRAGEDPSAHQRFLEIRAAFEILGDPARRAAYDREPTAAQDEALALVLRRRRLARRRARLLRLYD